MTGIIKKFFRFPKCHKIEDVIKNMDCFDENPFIPRKELIYSNYAIVNIYKSRLKHDNPALCLKELAMNNVNNRNNSKI